MKMIKEKIKDADLTKFAKKNYSDYAISVLEERAIPDFTDGLNPVNRRVLWSAHQLGLRGNKDAKSARIIGDVIGKYHPHGDKGCYDAMVKMVGVFNGKLASTANCCVPLIEGIGNFGSLSSNTHAAMRYTEARLSKVGDAILFDPFYMPVVSYVPNYDNKEQEPLVLPALLPLLFLNGRFGIAPGATTHIPAFEYESVLNMLEQAYAGEELTAGLMAKTLKLTSTYGGVLSKKLKEERVEYRKLFKNRTGKATLLSTYTFDEKKKTITVTKFAPIPEVEKVLVTIMGIKGVQNAVDDSSQHDRYGTLTIKLSRSLPPVKVKKVVRAVMAKLSKSQNYIINLTARYVDDIGQGRAKLFSDNIIAVMNMWIKQRAELEVRACTHWITDAAARIRRVELLIIAVDHLDIIFKALRKKSTTEVLEKEISTKLKVNLEEAKYILDQKIRSLNSLEKIDLLAKKKNIVDEKTGLEKRKKHPVKFMSTQLKSFRGLFS